MRKLDRRNMIHFIDLTGAAPADCPVDRRELIARFHALEDEKLLSGAAAFAAMWRVIPIFRPLGLAARNPYLLACIEKLYGVFLRARPRLQRLAHMMEP